MTKIKNCLLCKNYNTHPCECEHCEDWDNFYISESGKALREKIYGDGYQDGHKDGYDKGYDDAQANYERPKGKWIYLPTDGKYKCLKCDNTCKCSTFPVYRYCPWCGSDNLGDDE